MEVEGKNFLTPLDSFNWGKSSLKAQGWGRSIPEGDEDKQNQWGLWLPATTSLPRKALSADQYLLIPSDQSIGTSHISCISFLCLFRGLEKVARSSCFPVSPWLFRGTRERKLIEKQTLKTDGLCVCAWQHQRDFAEVRCERQSSRAASEAPSLPSSHSFLSVWSHFLPLHPPPLPDTNSCIYMDTNEDLPALYDTLIFMPLARRNYN